MEEEREMVPSLLSGEKGEMYCRVVRSKDQKVYSGVTALWG
jgi:hypothetical protein